MAVLYISEHSRPSLSYGNLLSVSKMPPLTSQTVVISGVSNQSSAFSSTTYVICVHADAACSVKLGLNPTATTNFRRLAGGLTEYFEVSPGDKIAVIENLVGAASGVATETKQDVGNTSLASIDSKTALYQTRADTYTSTASGTTVDISTKPLQFYSIQVKGTGTVTSWDVRLEGSLDGANFSQVLQHTQVTGDGAVLFSGNAAYPALYFRSRCSGLVLGAGTNIVVTILGVD